MNTEKILKGVEKEEEFDDKKYCIETLKLLTEIRDRQTELLNKINDLVNLGDDNERLKGEHEIVSTYNKDSGIIIETDIQECTDKLLLLAIRGQIIELLEKNRTAFISTWDK